MTPMEKYLEARETLSSVLQTADGMGDPQRLCASVSVETLRLLLAGPPVSREEIASKAAFETLRAMTFTTEPVYQKTPGAFGLHTGTIRLIIQALYQGAPK